MKQFINFVVLIVTATLHSFGQANTTEPTKEEKIQALEVAFISRKLNLTTQEAQTFWPIYNEYKREIRAVAAANKDKVDVLSLEEKVLTIRKQYKDKFTGVIGQPRMNQFFQAEREFRGILLNRLRKKPGPKQGIKQRIKK